MKYQIYILPKKRDKFFQHFLSGTAEDKYLNNYRVFESEIETNERFFDFATKQISVPILSVTRGDFYLTNFLRVYDNLQKKYYYYDVLGVAKQTQNVIIFDIKLDEYHTFFNNRGNYYNFKGYLKFSNTRAIDDNNKLFTLPTKSLGDFTFKSLPFKYFSDGKSYVYALIIFKGSESGINKVVCDTWSSIFANIVSTATFAGRVGKFTRHYKSGDTWKTQDETIEIIGVYVVPFYFIDSEEKEKTYWTIDVNGFTAQTFYQFIAAPKLTQEIDLNNYRTKIVEFGTFSSRLNLGVSGGKIKINAQLIVLGDGIDVILWNGTQKVSIAKDLEIVVSSSAINQYINSNKMALALKGIAAAGGTVASIATGNIAGAISGVAAGLNIANEVYQETQKTGNLYGNSGAELSYTFTKPAVLQNINDPFYLWIFSPENENFLIETKFLFGGDCRNAPISFVSMINFDKQNPTAAYNYYEFSKIVSDYPQANRIVPLLLGGIEMEFLE